MKKLAFACVIAAFSFEVGCKTMTVAPVAPVNSANRIPPGARIYVATPNDGNYNGRLYPGSGAVVATAFDSAFSRFSNSVIVGPRSDSAADGIARAKEKNCAYAVMPNITKWEDRATEWSGIRDKMELFVKVIRVDDGVSIASAEIKGKSRWMTFGGDHPQDLVKVPVDQFVATLF